MEPASQTASAQQLVVVGASAGGVEALSALVATLPADLPAAVVVAQHLDPSRPSHLGEILARRGAMPVRTVEGPEKLVAGTIFVVAANRHVSITDHEISVLADGGERPVPSIDLLFDTAARVFGDRTIGVVLTGLGSDGASGAHAVKEVGGTIVIQDPATAAYPSMPRSLAPALVDVAAPLHEIGPTLVRLLDGDSPDDAVAAEDLAGLVARLKERRGIDFGAYKTPTVRRRLHRRMVAARQSTVADYLGLLDTDPEEEQRLVADLLIKVTRFFRDAALFDELRGRLLPELLDAARREGRELRVWSAGCATGEEAYSLAILLADLIAERGALAGVRIFATDLDEGAVAFARRGVYPAGALGDVPPSVLTRHFAEFEDGFEVGREVRSMIVFGGHDLAQRPPFPHTDLVLCRNVLIYFTPELQRRALDLFAYSLRDDGYLVLGKSETAGSAEHTFVPADRRLRIYRRGGGRASLPPGRLPAVPTQPSRTAPRVPSARAMALALGQAEGATRDALRRNDRTESLVRRLPVGVVVVDLEYDIETINGAARELLGIHGTAVNQDLVHLARRVPSSALREAIDAVGRGEPARALEPLETSETATGETRHLAIACYPDRTTAGGAVETVLVTVLDVTAAGEAQRAKDAEAAALRRQVAALDDATADLRATVDRLTGANRQLLAANREITDAVDELREQGDELREQGDELRLAAAAAQVAAEEIETLNEELQSSNEELETLHEEAQATVEELNVSNEELQARAAELELMGAEQSAERTRLAAILAGMGDAVLVVDRHGRTLLTNDAYRELAESPDLPFVPADEQGDPLPAEATPQRRVARGEAFRMDLTAAGRNGTRRSFEAIGRPLLGEEAGVLVVRDITDRSVRRLQEEFLSWAGHELRGPLAALQSLVQLAARRAGPGADERLLKYLDLSVAQIRRQSALVDELVEATRLRSGRLTLRTTGVDLGELARRVAETAQVLATGQAIEVEAPDAPVVVEADAGRIEQVLVNLLSNAVAYAPGTERIDVRVRRAEGGAELVVQDYGPGVPAAALPDIFERFSRGESSPRPTTGGLGLGLYITREIVRHHGGTIDVASPPGQGATFTVRLPLAAAASSTPPAPARTGR